MLPALAFVLAAANPWEILTGFPAYVTMQTYHPPDVASVMGKTHLYYEVFVLNAYGSDIDVRSLNVSGSGKTIAAFGGDTLASMIRPLGRLTVTAPSRTIAAAETAVFYVDLPFDGPHDVPKMLDDRLTFGVPDAAGHVFTVDQGPIAVGQRSPIVIAPPLSGDDWFAADAPANDTGHRRTIFYKHGRPFLGQRLAIDWVKGKVDSSGHLAFFHDDPKKNENWYCYDQPLYAVASGIVVGVRTDLPDNVPLEPLKIRISEQTLGGNYVVINIGFGRYAFYAHMRQHSATVKAGDRVVTGQVVGRLGNSGNSTGPHLHFHVTDAPEFIFAEGEPYAFATMRAAMSTFDADKEEDGAQLVSGFQTYGNTMPGKNAVVDFGRVAPLPER